MAFTVRGIVCDVTFDYPPSLAQIAKCCNMSLDNMIFVNRKTARQVSVPWSETDTDVEMLIDFRSGRTSAFAWIHALVDGEVPPLCDFWMRELDEYATTQAFLPSVKHLIQPSMTVTPHDGLDERIRAEIYALSGTAHGDSDTTWVLAWRGETLVGCLSVQHDGLVRNIFVSPTRRRQGIATEMITQARCHMATERYYGALEPLTHMSARGLFESFGVKFIEIHGRLLGSQ